MTLVKICGLTTPGAVDAAIEAGADYLGFAHFERSPRHLSLDAIAALLRQSAGRDVGDRCDVGDRRGDTNDTAQATSSDRVKRVILLVDPSPTLLAEVAALGPDLIQLHGHETPEAVAAARARGVPIIKVLPVATAADLTDAGSYAADYLMFDAKAPAGSDRPGGHGAAFDWSLLSNVPSSRPQRSASGAERRDLGPQPAASRPEVPGRPSAARDDGMGMWFLAGGLTPANVGEALRITRAPAVDVSSGVESAPGVKDPALIAAFIKAVRAHDAQQETP